MKRARQPTIGNQSHAGYDRLAPMYRTLESILFANRLQEARVALIEALPTIESALFFGDGDGRLLNVFATRFPNCLITSVDQSRRMLDLQQKRFPDHTVTGRQTLIQANALDYHPPPGQFDLLVCSFFLDCFSESELARAFPQWLSALRPDGLLYFVDFRIPESGWRRLRGRCLSWLMHRFFRHSTGLKNRALPDFESLFASHDLDIVADADTRCASDTGTQSAIDSMCVCRIYRMVKNETGLRP
ncbi:class I SAM-dependent methyltransferase [Roseiconus lacunae]|uniref:class I SAM-dependent methyltransferase n=1 Tax=Roseiconus lacunae TaxID=2605694 RepID=UPI001E41CFE9|nr:class I SAM-dependent methyltransferase [Roseiconus lacunae]MCD0462248.1 class I SAM-dependent methyltransferase [Roseiconus lacunae]